MTREFQAVDLFAGPLPGGWDVAAVELGLDPLGVELDDPACRVREAAGLGTLKGDVSALDPEEFPCELLIASPPCTAFSMAGNPLDGGSGARRLLREAQEAGRWVMRANAATNATVRDVDEPAPTITGGHDHGDRVWKYDPRQTGAAPRPVEEPAPTMLAEGLAKGVPVWIGGHHTPGAQSQNAVRVSIEQAACLQSFPAGYPWDAAGSRSAAFRCIGNAVPPPLARAVLAEALSSVNEAAA